ECIISDKVTENLPVVSFKRSALKLPRNIPLADPNFNVSSEIDMLIGAELFWELLCVGQISGSTSHPLLQKTRLGWILAGHFGRASLLPKMQSNHAIVTNRQLHEQVNRLWQLDDNFAASSAYSPEERFCEQHFVDNVSQNPQGRYLVKLPIKEHFLPKLDDSRNIAFKRLMSLEKRFARNPSLKSQYGQFTGEYLALGHMRMITPPLDESAPTFYLPHYCVVKVAGSGAHLAPRQHGKPPHHFAAARERARQRVSLSRSLSRGSQMCITGRRRLLKAPRRVRCFMQIRLRDSGVTNPADPAVRGGASKAGAPGASKKVKYV
ncbi:hypothetical protein ALC57_15767, partial [Trachymyrmex cornetzi]